MADQQNAPVRKDTYEWHPDYAGQSFDGVQRSLADSLRRDQASYQVALESAEREEHDAFNTVRDLEKRWSLYDFAWFEQDPELLARKISRFEQERESRQQMISWQDWKNEGTMPSSPAAGVTAGKVEKKDWRENLSDDQRRKLASALSILVLLTLALMCVLIYFLVR